MKLNAEELNLLHNVYNALEFTLTEKNYSQALTTPALRVLIQALLDLNSLGLRQDRRRFNRLMLSMLEEGKLDYAELNTELRDMSSSLDSKKGI